MRYSYKLLSLFLTISFLAFTACEEDLELEPEQDLSTDLAFSDQSTSQASLMGVYSFCQDLHVFGSQPQIIADYQPDNVNFVGSFPTLQDVNTYSTLSDNGSIESIWNDHYLVILGANAVISRVPQVEDDAFDQATRDQYVAEAKFVRALTYFNLVNLFAHPYQVEQGSNPGVPLVLEPTILDGEITYPTRATVNEVHAQIQQDLEDAKAALPESYGSAAETRGRATVGAANALLSRLHLYREEWDQADQRAQDVINSGVYSMAGNLAFYSQNTSESVFSIQNSATDNGRTGAGSWGEYYSSAANGGRGDCPFSEDLINAFDTTNDRRFTQLTLFTAGEGFFTLKYDDPTTFTDNAPLIRVSEMYLNRAEAMVEMTGMVTQQAIDMINPIRQRAGLDPYETDDFANEDELLEAIYKERRLELCFEGHRRMDKLRTGGPLRADMPDVSALGADKTVLPIPQREIDLSPNLTQNPGY